ncbi:MAG TPA: hypothetical protein VKR83_07825, partial [Ktedonobacteraceae bacterium]|nr:hypothetical protein [Ktedonobacteraceae bacterium]
QGDMASIHAPAQEARVLSQHLGDQGGKAFSLYLLGLFARFHSSEFAQARALFEESIVLGRETGNKERLGWSLWALGGIYSRQAEYTKACAC